ncbi:TetR/AcrR family transcriptional regulator [Mycoplasmatota bacterium]|nr:TetR/AcrR family transcriptional regulator [Mycoplasmatota bacterium]
MEDHKKNFEKKQELIDAAIEEFGNNGYEKASLNNILKAAGISKGTFYYHFKNKEDLYFYLLTFMAEDKQKFFQDRLTMELFNQDFFTIFEKLIEFALEFATQNPQINKFAESYMKEKNNLIYQKIVEHFGDQRVDFFDAIIDKAYQKGEIRQDISIEFQKNMVYYLMTHVVEIADIIEIEDFKKASIELIKFIRHGLENSNNN